MPEGREPLMCVACGERGIGKTYTTLKIINSYLAGNPAKGIMPRRVLILDYNNEFPQFKALRVEDCLKFSVHPVIECRRISIIKKSGSSQSIKEICNMLKFILENFRCGLLLLEDITRYVSDNLPADLIGTICTTRHKEVDLMLHFQSIGKGGHPKMVASASYYRLHHCNDSVGRHKIKFDDKYPLFQIAQNIVNNKYDSGDIRFYLRVMNETSKIQGAFTIDDFKKATGEYFDENSSLISGMMQRRTNTGVKIYSSYADAYNDAMNKYIRDYYGNAQ